MTADLIIRLLTPDLDWDQYFDLTARSFGPADEALRRAGLASGGSPAADAALDGAFAATPCILDSF